MTSGVKFCPEAHVAFDWSAPTYPFHYFEFVHWWCVSIYIWNNCIFGWFSVWKFITCLFLEMPRFFMFNFGAFQKNMHMASREKTSFACFLGHFILPRVVNLIKVANISRHTCSWRSLKEPSEVGKNRVKLKRSWKVSS